MPLESLGDARQIAVERALAEFRAARPVAIRSATKTVLAFPVEELNEKHMAFLQQKDRHLRLIVPGEKLNVAGAWIRSPATVRLKPFTLEKLEAYLAHHEKAYGAAVTDLAEAAALALANLAQLLPAVIVVDASVNAILALPVLAVDAGDVFAFRDRAAKSLKVVSRAFVPLEGAGRCEFVVFRGGDGFRDQIAILVSDPSPSRPVLARIHSACLTGDLFGSLKCDCGEQLRGAVKAMAEQGGGVVLYLDQEGRGNGIANKMRAYRLQDQGLDTYDADEMLGFGQDQRRFDFAGEMLKQLGFASVRLMTNNPEKVAALESGGITVLERVSAEVEAQDSFERYLRTKQEKMGHIYSDANGK